MPAPPAPPPPAPLKSFPSADAVLAFIRESPVPVGKREIARAFRLTGSHEREQLKDLLKRFEAEGHLERGRGRRVAPPAALPEMAALEIIGLDDDGEPLARPLTWSLNQPPPRIFLVPGRGADRTAPAVGARVLARLARVNDRLYEAHVLRHLDATGGRVLGVFRASPEGGRIVPTDRRDRDELLVLAANSLGSEDGELVLAEVIPATRLGLTRARVVERLADAAAPGAISLIAIHAHGLPSVFTAPALAEAAAASPPPPKGRVDLTGLALVTIDGADARDFDDAVFAEPDPDPANPGGWHLVVAIADVAWYARPGGALDRAAFERGNSCYFPDQVVPMLPEALSNGLCSLIPGEPRGCLAVHLWIDREGLPRHHRFERALMRSAARLTYEEVEAAHRGRPSPALLPLMETVIAPLYGAFASLWRARGRRGTLDLDLPERQVRLDEAGRVIAIAARERLDSHRLIEEFMIAANVAAAETLEATGTCLYRVHDRPAPEKLESLRDILDGLGDGLGFAKGQILKPADFTRVLARVRGTPQAELVGEMILRAQAQATYSPGNLGHFGLALRHYAHFTSPIRRYADLVVHRALIAALDLGPGGLDAADAARLAEIGDHVSMTERRAAAAERDALLRHTAAFLADRVGASFAARVTGVSRFGLFVRLDEAGADGLVPASALPADRYDHVEHAHALVGRRLGRIYRLGAAVEVILKEADPLTGSTLFTLADAEAAARGCENLLPNGNAGLSHEARRRGNRRNAPRGKKAALRGK